MTVHESDGAAQEPLGAGAQSIPQPFDGSASWRSLLTAGSTRVMGIVNVTPDSFADDIHRSITQAIDHGIELSAEGAALIDVGGESTRPGAQRVDPATEMARIIPVIEALAGSGIAVSVDTTRTAVAQAAVRAGACFVNDVSGGLDDPGMLRAVAESGAAYILQHWRVPFDHQPSHTDVVVEVRAELAERAGRAVAAGLSADRLVLDPGLGFGKTAQQNWDLIAHATAIAELGYPVLWGTSRKRFLADVYPGPTEPWQRDTAGVALTSLLARERVWAVRTHQVADHRTAVAVAEAVRAGLEEAPVETTLSRPPKRL